MRYIIIISLSLPTFRVAGIGDRHTPDLYSLSHEMAFWVLVERVTSDALERIVKVYVMFKTKA